MSKEINIAKDFSKYPYGRLKKFSKTSGEEFRDRILVPALKENEKVTIILDGTEGYGSSFLDESFAELVRRNIFTSDEVLNKINFVSKDDPSLITEIISYIEKG